MPPSLSPYRQQKKWNDFNNISVLAWALRAWPPTAHRERYRMRPGRWPPGGGASEQSKRESKLSLAVRGWRNTVKIVLFETSNSMKPYPSVVHAYTNRMRPATGFVEPESLDEVSNRVPPTPQDQDSRKVYIYIYIYMLVYIYIYIYTYTYIYI